MLFFLACPKLHVLMALERIIMFKWSNAAVYGPSFISSFSLCKYAKRCGAKQLNVKRHDWHINFWSMRPYDGYLPQLDVFECWINGCCSFSESQSHLRSWYQMFLGSLKSNIKSEYVAKFRIASMFQKRFSRNLFRLRHPGFIRIWWSSDGAGLSCIILLPKKSCSLSFENICCVMFQNCFLRRIFVGLRRSSAQWIAHIGVYFIPRIRMYFSCVVLHLRVECSERSKLFTVAIGFFPAENVFFLGNYLLNCSLLVIIPKLNMENLQKSWLVTFCTPHTLPMNYFDLLLVKRFVTSVYTLKMSSRKLLFGLRSCSDHSEAHKLKTLGRISKSLKTVPYACFEPK